MNEDRILRPLERRVLRLSAEGLADGEIARRFRRSPAMIRRVIEMAHLPGSGSQRISGDVLRPLERLILRWRAKGASFEEIAPRLNRSAKSVERIEGFAHYKLGRKY